MSKIVQIIPAGGWNVVYFNEEPDDKGDWFFISPLSCWALVEFEGDLRVVEGIDHGDLSYGESCGGAGNFCQYVHDRDVNNPNYRARWNEEGERRKKLGRSTITHLG